MGMSGQCQTLQNQCCGALLCSKQIRFGIMNPADVIKNAVLHAHATKLYEVGC